MAITGASARPAVAAGRAAAGTGPEYARQQWAELTGWLAELRSNGPGTLLSGKGQRLFPAVGRGSIHPRAVSLANRRAWHCRPPSSPKMAYSRCSRSPQPALKSEGPAGTLLARRLQQCLLFRKARPTPKIPLPTRATTQPTTRRKALQAAAQAPVRQRFRRPGWRARRFLANAGPGSAAPFDAQFEALAQQVWLPLYRHLQAVPG